MTAPAPVLADRVRKARAQSPCALCTSAIRVGNQIGHVPGRGWSHTSCIIERNRAASTEEEQ